MNEHNTTSSIIVAPLAVKHNTSIAVIASLDYTYKLIKDRFDRYIIHAFNMLANMLSYKLSYIQGRLHRMLSMRTTPHQV